MGDERRCRRTSSAPSRLDDERTEQPAPYLLRRDLVAVVPERANLLGAEAIDVALSRSTASWVTPATPSSAFGTSTPCQWIVTPSSTSSFTSVTSTRSPCRTRSSGPGDRPSNVKASTVPPEARRTVACRATSGSGRRAAAGSPQRGEAAAARGDGHRRPPAAAVVGGPVVHHAVRAREQAVVPRLADDGEHDERRDATSAAADPTEPPHGCAGYSSRLRSIRAMHERPLRVAVVGSGPAAFYAAGALLAAEPAGGGRPDRAAADAVGGSCASASRPTTRTSRRSRARSRRSRSGLASASSATSRREATSRTTSSRTPVRRRRLRGRRADGSPARDPGGGSSGLVGGHRARRLVQRPPRLPGPRVRPLGRAGGRGRQRERRARRRADAGAHARGARGHRHDRPRDRGDRVLRARARSSSSVGAGPCRRRGRRPSSRRWASSRART